MPLRGRGCCITLACPPRALYTHWHLQRFLEVLEDGVRQSLRRFPLLDGRFEVEGETPPLASSSQPQSPQGPLLPVPHVLEGSPEGSPADDPRTAAPPSQMRRRSHRKTPTSTPSHAAHSPSRGDSAAGEVWGR